MYEPINMINQFLLIDPMSNNNRQLFRIMYMDIYKRYEVL